MPESLLSEVSNFNRKEALAQIFSSKFHEGFTPAVSD